jgi:hypothetical protein
MDGPEQLHVTLGYAALSPTLTILNVFHAVEVKKLRLVYVLSYRHTSRSRLVR